MTRPTEDALIARYFAPLATDEGADNLLDDAALFLIPAGEGLVVTTDALVSSVHFLPDDPPGTIARKALRVNLSDLAAKGARPEAFLLTLALPPDWHEAWLAAFAEGLAEDCRHFHVRLLGGDTVRTPGPLALSITAFGLVPGTSIPRRRGARPGDQLFVSGTIGDGALGLEACRGSGGILEVGLDEEDLFFLRSRYRVPQPRVELADLVRREASASMDVSDGLAGDLAKLCRVSGVSATVEVDAVPLSKAARIATKSSAALFELAVTGGDDYEILCAVPPSRAHRFASEAASLQVQVTRIGEIIEGNAPPNFVRGGRSQAFQRPSFSHF